MSTPAPFRFRETFSPASGVDYTWVISYARDEYVRSVEVFRRLDDKAAAIVNYLGAGTGVITLGSMAGVAADKVPLWVIVAAIPSVASAMFALYFAATTRKTASRPLPPSVEMAARYAKYFAANQTVNVKPSEAEVQFLVEWHECVEGMYDAVKVKGESVDMAQNCFLAAVLCLMLPLTVSIGLRIADQPKPAMYPCELGPVPASVTISVKP